jgi:hypothetical protein
VCGIAPGGRGQPGQQGGEPRDPRRTAGLPEDGDAVSTSPGPTVTGTSVVVDGATSAIDGLRRRRNDEGRVLYCHSMAACRRADPPPSRSWPPMTDGAITDGELIARVGDGDANAFELLYRRYARPVFALALRRLGDRGRAEDAVQETFASIWRSAGSYRRERGPGAPWLAVARNAIVDGDARWGPTGRGDRGSLGRGRAGQTRRVELDNLACPSRSRQSPEQERRLIGSPTGAASPRARSPVPRHPPER